MQTKTREELMEYFQKKGVKNPESWAEEAYESEESLIATYEILEQLFFQFSKKCSVEYYREAAKKAQSRSSDGTKSPIEEQAELIENLLAQGIEEKAINTLLQVQTKHAFFRFATIIDGMMGIPGRTRETRWLLYEIDEDEKPLRPVSMLHDRINDESFFG